MVRAEARTLRARRAEILHLMGRHAAALREFAMTSRIDAETVFDAGVETGTLSGRSRRMFTRLLVELARARLFDAAGNRPVRYKMDGLTLPVISRAAIKPALLIRAERIVEESLRVMPHGSVNDWIGVKIDQARLAAVQLHYAEALDLLDHARGLVRTPGASRDMLLEYLSIQGRTLADAAAFAMAAGAVSPFARGEHAGEIGALAAHLRVDPALRAAKPWVLADAVSERLSRRATACLDTLRDLVDLPDMGDTRYGIFVAYLETWISVVRSRERLPSADEVQRKAEVRAQLVQAARRLEQVLAKMVRAGYLLSHREAWLLVDALASAGISVNVPAGLPGRTVETRNAA